MLVHGCECLFPTVALRLLPQQEDAAQEPAPLEHEICLKCFDKAVVGMAHAVTGRASHDEQQGRRRTLGRKSCARG